jgi:hypothetical protein
MTTIHADKPALSRCAEVSGPKADSVIAPDDGVKTIADGGRIEYRASRSREGLPAALAVARQQQAAVASVAQENRRPVAGYHGSRTRIIGIYLH